jgi:hypothetical protein
MIPDESVPDGMSANCGTKTAVVVVGANSTYSAPIAVVNSETGLISLFVAGGNNS